MVWTNEDVLCFMEHYRRQNCIWNPKHPFHKNRNRVHDSWNEIRKAMTPFSIEDLKKKKDSLMAAYRIYKKRVKNSKKSGASSDDVYKPTWFAYELMDSFLGSVYDCNLTISNEDSISSPNTENSNSQEATGNLPPDIKNKKISTGDTNTNSATDPISTPTTKRRHCNPPELKETKIQTNQAFDIYKNVPKHSNVTSEDDECDLFGKLLAKKLRRCPEGYRDLLMVKINQLVYETSLEFTRSNAFPTTTTFPSLPITTSSPNNSSTSKQLLGIDESNKSEIIGSKANVTLQSTSNIPT